MTYAEIDTLITECKASPDSVPRKTAMRLVDAVLLLRKRLYGTELPAAEALPPLPDGWVQKDSDDSRIAFVGFFPGEYSDWEESGCPVLATRHGVMVGDLGQVNVDDLIVVLRHAQAAQARLATEADRG